MRTELRDIYRSGKTRDHFSGTFNRIGTKSEKRLKTIGGEPQTVLISNIRDLDGTKVADHVWFDYNSSFKCLEQGDVIVFDADIHRYLKGYADRGKNVDMRYTNYTLIDPKNIRKVENNE